jgi:hypothetical protein
MYTVLGAAEQTTTCGNIIPPLRLRSAYTQKGFGIGAGAFLGFLVGNYAGALGGAFVGWLVGNKIAANAEETYMTTC